MSHFPCRADLDFFNTKRMPHWAKLLATFPGAIDTCVNAHAGLRVTSGQCAAHNLLVIIRGMGRRGKDIGQALAHIAEYPECAISPEKRAAFALKWARRLGVVAPGKGSRRAPVQRHEFTL